MVQRIQNAERAFVFAFSCSEIPFVIICLFLFTVMEEKQSLTQKGLGKVRRMNL